MHIIKRRLHQRWQPLTRLLIQQWKGLLMCTVSPLSSSCFLSSGASSHNSFPFLLFSRQPGIEVLRNTSSTLSYPLLTVLFHLNLHFYFDFSFWMVLDVTIGIGKVKTWGQLVPAVLTDRWVDRSALYKSWLRRRGRLWGNRLAWNLKCIKEMMRSKRKTMSNLIWLQRGLLWCYRTHYWWKGEPGGAYRPEIHKWTTLRNIYSYLAEQY